jgi:glyoxylase-like metal-dependent hydrolase (beta-lactamase superfamily II)
MNLQPTKCFAILCLLISTLTTVPSSVASAINNKNGAIEKAIIAKVIKAYGGERLIALKSIVLIDHNKRISSGQGENPHQPGFFRINEELTIDFERNRKSMLSWRVSRTSKDLEKLVFDGKHGRIYDILNHKYSHEDWLNFESTGSAIVRRSDTMLARSLTDKGTNVSYQGDEIYLGVAHNKLTVKIGTGVEYMVFVDNKLGVISKMARQHPRAGEIIYAFSNHSKSDGLTFAQDLNFTVGGKPVLVSIARGIKVSPSLIKPFAVPVDYSPWGELVNTSELIVNKIASNVYHAGKGRSFTLFIDAGEYFIASGGHDGIKEKFQAVKSLENLDKPLKYVISTHHHNEHLPALKEAVELGAKIITVDDHQSAITKHFSPENTADLFQLINGQATFGDGAVEIYEISTMHADKYLLVYVPAAKLVFAEDHFETQLKTAVPRVHKDMVVFKQAMEALALDVEHLVDGHSPRQLSISEFNAATDAYKGIICPKGYSICEKG